MKKNMKNWRRGMISLAGALLINFSQPCNGQSAEFVYGPITNSTGEGIVVLKPLEQTQYLVQATSSGNGSVESSASDLENYVDKGSNVTLNAIAGEHYKFAGWTGLPSETSTNNPISFNVDRPYTNIVANFVSKVSITNNIGFSLIKPDGNNIHLEIPETLESRMYSIYSTTNLVNPNLVWNKRTNAPGNGNILKFDLPMDGDVGFFKAKESYEE